MTPHMHSCSHSLVLSSVQKDDKSVLQNLSQKALPPKASTQSVRVRSSLLEFVSKPHPSQAKHGREIPSKIRTELTHRIKCGKRKSREKNITRVRHREICCFEASEDLTLIHRILQPLSRKSIFASYGPSQLSSLVNIHEFWASGQRCTSAKRKTISNASSSIWNCKGFGRSSKWCKRRSATFKSVVTKTTDSQNKWIGQMVIGEVIRCWITELPNNSAQKCLYSVIRFYHLDAAIIWKTN